MPQRVRLDRPRLVAYLGLLALGCGAGAPGPVVPVGAAPVSEAAVAGWVRATAPSDSRLYRFKWLFQDEKGSAGGRGSARIAPPDSLRFDAAGPFGSGAASAVVVGDQPVWTEPADAISRFVPNYPLMWAMFGIARMPEPGAQLSGDSTGSTVAWRYATPGDTVEYARTGGDAPRLIAEVRQRGEVIGRVETTLGADGAPRSARLTVPSVPAKLDLSFLSTERTAFAPEIWHRRKP